MISTDADIGRLSDEAFDRIQQVLRLACLEYGASLAYTSMHSLETYSRLRALVCQRLFGMHIGDAATARHNIVEKDRIFIPAGWDSIGKIRVLRDDFDPKDEKWRNGSWNSLFLVARPQSTVSTVVGTGSLFQAIAHDNSAEAEDEQSFLASQVEALSAQDGGNPVGPVEKGRVRAATANSQ